MSESRGVVAASLVLVASQWRADDRRGRGLSESSWTTCYSSVTASDWRVFRTLGHAVRGASGFWAARL